MSNGHLNMFSPHAKIFINRQAVSMIFANQTACQLRIDGQNTPQNIVDTFIHKQPLETCTFCCSVSACDDVTGVGGETRDT